VSIPSFAVLWLVLSAGARRFRRGDLLGRHSLVPKGQWEAARSTGLRSSGTLG
jgi:ABC-type amino acid transport system permease subunit